MKCHTPCRFTDSIGQILRIGFGSEVPQPIAFVPIVIFTFMKLQLHQVLDSDPPFLKSLQS